MRFSSASASIWSTITLRICAVLSAASCGISSTPRRKLVAGGLELVVHFGGHLLHALHHVGELLRRLLEHRVGFLGALLIDLVHRLGGQPALLFGRGANRLELPADRGRTGAGGFRDHARDIAGALFGGGQRFVEQAGEARQPLIEIGGAQIDGGDQRFQRRLAFGDRDGGVAVALLDQGRGLDQRLAVRLELARTASRDPPAPSRSWR